MLLCVMGGGTPSKGGTPSQVGGYPISGRGYPITGQGGKPSQVGIPRLWSGGYPISGRGYPISGLGGTWGTHPPSRPGQGVPSYLDLRWDTPPDLRWGTPPT